MRASLALAIVSLAGLLLVSACGEEPAGGDRTPSPIASNPVAPSRAPLAIPTSGSSGGESLAGGELDPFSLPADFHAASGPLTPSTTTLPVDETYGGSAGWAFKITQAGSGNAGWFRITSPSSANRMALLATHTGEGIAARAINTGRGRALWAQIPEAGNPFPALVATHVGSGEAIQGVNFGSGSSGVFEVRNPSSTAATLIASHGGQGPAGRFEVSGGSTPTLTPTIEVVNGGEFAPGIDIRAATGLNIDASRFGLIADGEIRGALLTTSTGVGLDVQSEEGFGTWVESPKTVLRLTKLFGDPTRPAFEILRQVSAGGANRMFEIQDSGLIEASFQSISGDLARFKHGLTTRVRFDHTGKGFFDGGTQTGGADIAESFDVEGPILRYEPGDVLVISTRRDRRVERSAEPYSMRLIGVYATRPGVLLSDEGIDDASWGRVPVGVVGVVPTKVTTEGGPIRRGDILVSSSRPGHAMKADPERAREGRIPTGSVLGKALEPFDGPGTGLVQVMVNVK